MTRTPLLSGEYELTIDEKSRLTLPAEIRKLLDPARDGDGFFLTVGVNRRPWIYTERSFEFLAEQVPVDIAPGDEMLMYDQLTFATTNRVEMDKQNRILLPEKTIRRTGLAREITMLGARDHLELWNRDEWIAFYNANESRRSEISLRAKQARSTASSIKPPPAV